MADREDDESLAGLTQNTFVKAPLERCFDLFSRLFEGDSNLGECSKKEVDTLNSKHKVKLCKNEKSETTRSEFHNFYV